MCGVNFPEMIHKSKLLPLKLSVNTTSNLHFHNIAGLNCTTVEHKHSGTTDMMDQRSTDLATGLGDEKDETENILIHTLHHRVHVPWTGVMACVPQWPPELRQWESRTPGRSNQAEQVCGVQARLEYAHFQSLEVRRCLPSGRGENLASTHNDKQKKKPSTHYSII